MAFLSSACFRTVARQDGRGAEGAALLVCCGSLCLPQSYALTLCPLGSASPAQSPWGPGQVLLVSRP